MTVDHVTTTDTPARNAGARFAAIAARLERLPLSVIQLTARVGVGAVFFRSGLLKLSSWEFAVQLFRDEYKVPLLDPLTAARITAAVELGVPVLLFLGLATRLATLPLLAMIAVIQVFVYPNAWSDHLLWTTALLLLLTRGAGAISVDHLIAKVFVPTGADRRSGCT
jgi:putative oxidoreductase